jgi:hypothetical protein
MTGFLSLLLDLVLAFGAPRAVLVDAGTPAGRERGDHAKGALSRQLQRRPDLAPGGRRAGVRLDGEATIGDVLEHDGE